MKRKLDGLQNIFWIQSHGLTEILNTPVRIRRRRLVYFWCAIRGMDNFLVFPPRPGEVGSIRWVKSVADLVSTVLSVVGEQQTMFPLPLIVVVVVVMQYDALQDCV
jgi:hypothetical protein